MKVKVTRSLRAHKRGLLVGIVVIGVIVAVSAATWGASSSAFASTSAPACPSFTIPGGIYTAVYNTSTGQIIAVGAASPNGSVGVPWPGQGELNISAGVAQVLMCEIYNHAATSCSVTPSTRQINC
jgi:hypothetical protein